MLNVFYFVNKVNFEMFKNMTIQISENLKSPNLNTSIEIENANIIGIKYKDDGRNSVIKCSSNKKNIYLHNIISRSNPEKDYKKFINSFYIK